MTMPFIAPGDHLQRVQTGYARNFTDQHGRHFAAQFDTRNQRPKQELAPVGFSPPWLPPMRYIKWDAHDGRSFQWDYESMAGDLVEQATVYYASVMDFMLEHMKDWLSENPMPQIGEPVPNMVMRSPLGAPPLSPAIVLACQAGEPWALGVPGATVNVGLKATLEQSTTSTGRSALMEVSERMAAMVGGNAVPTVAPNVDESLNKAPRTIRDTVAPEAHITYQQFVNECRARGMDMKDIYEAWAKHKEFLEESSTVAA